jgi:dinuclear metal center YbgI/SA1388 family protein
MLRAALVEHLDAFLRIDEISDYGPQGLQVEGREDVRKIVATVDAGLPCVEAALEREADLLLVHHGIFWGPARRLSGGYGRLVRRFVESGINLYAAHLPLDAHPQVGNNAELCRLLGLEPKDWWGMAKGTPIGAMADAPAGTSLDSVVARFTEALGEPLKVLAHGPKEIRKVAVMSGGGARYIAEAAAHGCDLYLTGETSQSEYYEALNAGIHVVYGGHYLTETVGLRALGREIEAKFDLEFEFVDLPTGV